MLAEYKLKKDNVMIIAVDGAANGLAAVQLLNSKTLVCFPHQLQRIVVYTVGWAGGPGGGAIDGHVIKFQLDKFRKMAFYFKMARARARV